MTKTKLRQNRIPKLRDKYVRFSLFGNNCCLKCKIWWRRAQARSNH